MKILELDNKNKLIKHFLWYCIGFLSYMDIIDNIKWLIVQIKPNSYDLANRNLERQGFETFIPKMKVTNKINNKFITKEAYVFPGYIFVAFNPFISMWQKINYTYGVSKVLSFNKKPAEISSDLIIQIKNKYNLNDVELENDELNQGDLVKLYSGPFVDFFAKVEKVDQNHRVWLLLEHNGKIQRVNLKKSRGLQYKKI